MDTIKNDTQSIRAMTRTEMALKYKVHIKTLNKWFNKFPEIEKKCVKCILTPAEVKLIFDRIGEP